MELSLQECVNRLRELPASELHTLAPGMTPELLSGVASLITRHEDMARRLEKDVPPRITRESVPVEKLLQPISDEVAADLTDRVLEEGELPSIRRPGKSATPSSPKHITEADLPSVVARRAAQMALIEPEGDRAVYYYPEELEKIVRDIARQMDEPVKDRVRDRVRELMLSALKANSGGLQVKQITDIVPSGFMRSDKVEVVSEFTGRPLDMTQVARTLWKKVPQSESAGAVRAVVIKGGRRIYFVNAEVVMRDFGRFAVPFLNKVELTKIAANPQQLQKLVLQLSGQAELPSEFALVGVIGNIGKISGLKVVTIAEMEKLSQYYFKLRLRPSDSGLTLLGASGKGAARIAEGMSLSVSPKGPRGYATVGMMADIVTAPVVAPIKLGVAGARLVSSAVRVLPEPVRVAAKNGAGFFLGEVGSEALLGHWDYFKHLSPAKVARSYVSLTLGGEAGRLAASELSVFKAVRALPMVQGILNRFLPLFGAIVTNEAVETGHVEWSSLPKTALHVLAASQIVHGGIGLLSRSAFLTRLGRGIGLVSRLGRATFVGAALSTVAEFTLIKAFGIAEKHLNEKEAWGVATDRLISIVNDDQVQWASHDHRQDTDAALGALADQIRTHREGERQARAAEFAQELAQLDLWRKNAVAAPAPRRTRSVAEIDGYYDERRREIGSEQASAMKQFDPKPLVTFTRLSTDGYTRVPGVLAEVRYDLEHDDTGLPVRVGLPDESGGASVDNAPGYRETLVAYYRAQIATDQDWDALLEQIDQYRRDRAPKPPQYPILPLPKLPDQVLRIAQK